jgi:hypothetical protein
MMPPWSSPVEQGWVVKDWAWRLAANSAVQAARADRRMEGSFDFGVGRRYAVGGELVPCPA